eukprot:symbB.v1.2.025679.t1/scaffold2496.1/size77716/5
MQADAVSAALEDVELLRAWKRSKEYLSSCSVADWRAADGKGVEKAHEQRSSSFAERLQVQRRRRNSDPPRPDEVFDEREAKKERMCAIDDWQREGMPPMTGLKRIRVHQELFGDLIEVIDVMGRWNLDVVTDAAETVGANGKEALGEVESGLHRLPKVFAYKVACNGKLARIKQASYPHPIFGKYDK